MGSHETEAAVEGRARHRILDAVEALLWVGLILFGGTVAFTVLRTDPDRESSRAHLDPPPVGIVEAETLPVLGMNRAFTFWLQSTSDFRGGRWSRDGHMFAFGTQLGDWIDLALPEQDPGRYLLELFLTKAQDYGVVAVFVNGEPVGEELDLWSDRGVVPTAAQDMGIVELRGRGDVLRLAVVGSHPAASAPFFQFGIDGIRLESSSESSDARVPAQDRPAR
jgi:hypothetical protein